MMETSPIIAAEGERIVPAFTGDKAIKVFQSSERVEGNRSNEIPEGESKNEQFSKLKSLLQAPSKAPMSSVVSPLAPTSPRWGATDIVSPTKDSQHDALNSKHDKDVVNSKQHHKQSGNDVDARIDIQMFPLDLSCKTPGQRTSALNIEPQSSLNNQSQSSLKSQPQTSLNSQPQSSLSNQSQSSLKSQPQSSLNNGPQLSPNNHLQSSLKNQLQSSLNNQLQSSLPPEEKLQQKVMVTEQEERFGQNGQALHGDSGYNYRSPHSSDRMPELKPSSPVARSREEQQVQQPAKATAPFDPLFILSQVACEKLSELQSTEPEQRTSGKGKGRSKRSKKGHINKGVTRKSKKKSHIKTVDSDNMTVERLENGKPAAGAGFSESHSGHNVYNVHETNRQTNRQNGYLNQYAKYRDQTDVNMLQSHYGAKTGGIQTPDVMELSPSRRKHAGSVNDNNQGDGKVDKSKWPFTCRTCHTRFKNAAFLKIHEKIAHENKMARTDPNGDRIKFVAKDGGANSAPESPGNTTPTRNPFPIPHWKSSSGDVQTDGSQNQQGYTAIPCILKVHRQTSTSEMSSSIVKMEGDIIGMEDGQFQGKFEPAEIFRAAENGEFDSRHPRPKLEVDGSSYEIVKVERDKSAASGEPVSSSQASSSKGFQHKFYLQISDRNQSGAGVDSTVKIERGTTQIPLEDFDDVDDKNELKKRLLEGNPNQIRVPTSLALKFIPGDSGDPQSQAGFQHKVYLRIVDGSESSIRIKTGSMKSQSPNMVGSTAVKIESTYMNEMPRRQLLVNDTSRPHKCHYCPKHFPSISALTAHERIHTGEKPYECRFCGRAFYHQNDRRKHERIHTGEKPYQCSICGQKFTNKGQVKIHERNHTGERPYQCAHCHKCFKSISNVNRHEKIHTGLKPYTCPVCHRGFSRREHVRTHEEICRKKLIEDEEELADDPIGDVKLPYYRKITTVNPDASPVEGSPPFKDQPAEKRPRLDVYHGKEDKRQREEWALKQTQEFYDDRRRYDGNRADVYRKLEGRGPNEDIPVSSDGKDPDNLSPLLYNSGPPVKPEDVSSSLGIDKPKHFVSMEAVSDNTTKDNNDEKSSVESEPDSTHKYKPAGGDAFLPIGYDKNKPPIHVSYDPVDNKAKMPPPVLYVPGSGDSNSNDCQVPNDKPPLLFVSVPKRNQAPSVMIRRKPTDSSKLSAHIEALEPLPEQATVHAPDMTKKEPRHYVCGPQTNTRAVIQKEFIQDAKSSKLSESIPESERLLKPTIHSRINTGPQRVPVTEMYSDSVRRQEPVAIFMKTTACGSPSGGESPPVLCPQETICKVQSKPGMDEPPILSVVDEGPSKAAESPINAVPPLLERHERPFVDSKKNEISVGHTKNENQRNDRPIFDTKRNENQESVTDISQPFSIVHTQSSSSPNQS